jgi:DNA invertase Pin-like site-specific DNA recombinase
MSARKSKTPSAAQAAARRRNTAPGRTVAYVRVSSEAQTHDMQRNAIERAATARGDAVVEWYGERLSGKTLDRPELTRLRADACAGLVRRLYVYRIDRLTRSGIADTLRLVEEFAAYGCELVTVADGFQLQGPMAEVVLAMMAWAAKMERLAIAERMGEARKQMEAAGGKWGRPPRMTPAQVADARSRVAAGASVREVAVALSIPRATIARATKGAQPSQK